MGPMTIENVAVDDIDTFAITPDSLARVKSLAHFLDMSPESLLEQLIETALGDAHDGFLAAFTDGEQRKTANSALKQLVQLNLKHR